MSDNTYLLQNYTFSRTLLPCHSSSYYMLCLLISCLNIVISVRYYVFFQNKTWLDEEEGEVGEVSLDNSLGNLLQICLSMNVCETLIQIAFLDLDHAIVTYPILGKLFIINIINIDIFQQNCIVIILCRCYKFTIALLLNYNHAYNYLNKNLIRWYIIFTSLHF